MYLMLLMSVLLVACSEDDLPKYSVLGGLRVLAIQAENASGYAEGSPGDSFVITPYVSDFGASRTLSYEAVGCIDFGLSVGADPSCDGNPTAQAISTGTLTLAATERTGAGNTFSVTIPANILSGPPSRAERDQFNGVYYLIFYKLTASDGATTMSLKRIPISTRTTKNKNPEVTGILGAGGVALSVPPSIETDISIQFTAASKEAYEYKKSDLSIVSAREELTTTWFITDGELEYFRTIDTQPSTYTPPAVAPTGHTVVLVGVVRDNRGGVAFVRIPN